jgi:hypothetical protein
MKVYNKRDKNCSKDAVYVGRPSKWGNPFKIGIVDGRMIDREAVINLFRQYAIAKLKIEPHWLDELRGKDLVCWCSPKPCHADILLELANQE